MLNIKIPKELIRKTSIIISPGILSLLISLLAIKIHIDKNGLDDYANFIIFHFIGGSAIFLNFGIGKCLLIQLKQMSNFSENNRFVGLIYSSFILTIIAIILVSVFLIFFNKFFFESKYLFLTLLFISLGVFYFTFESIFQAYEKFKLLSIVNFIFFGCSVFIPSLLLLLINKDFEFLIKISLLIKFFSILFAFIFLIHLIKIRINFNNLKYDHKFQSYFLKNSYWFTQNTFIYNSYEVIDKYLIKFFYINSIFSIYALASQLCGKVHMLSKSITIYLLPKLIGSTSHNEMSITLNFFIKIFPMVIFLCFPFLSFLLSLWIGDSLKIINNLENLIKVLSISSIFSSASHILIAKFESNEKVAQLGKIEVLIFILFFIFFLSFLYYDAEILMFGVLILTKDTISLMIKILLYKNIIKNSVNLIIDIYFILLVLYTSFLENNIFFVILIILFMCKQIYEKALKY